MDEILNISTIVKQVLSVVPEARNSDDLLYIQVCGRINEEALTMPFCQVMAMRKRLNLPKYETVRRSRQKIQAEHPELRADAEVEVERKANEEVMKEFARR